MQRLNEIVTEAIIILTGDNSSISAKEAHEAITGNSRLKSMTSVDDLCPKRKPFCDREKQAR